VCKVSDTLLSFLNVKYLTKEAYGNLSEDRSATGHSVFVILSLLALEIYTLEIWSMMITSWRICSSTMQRPKNGTILVTNVQTKLGYLSNQIPGPLWWESPIRLFHCLGVMMSCRGKALKSDVLYIYEIIQQQFRLLAFYLDLQYHSSRPSFQQTPYKNLIIKPNY
jgi:hypothetical protein